VDTLLEVMELKRQARALKIEELDARREAVRVRFAADPPVAPETIVALLRSERGRLRYVPENALEYRVVGSGPQARLETARKLLQTLRAGATVPPAEGRKPRQRQG